MEQTSFKERLEHLRKYHTGYSSSESIESDEDDTTNFLFGNTDNLFPNRKLGDTENDEQKDNIEIINQQNTQDSAQESPLSSGEVDKERESHIVPGMSGLKNMGNTCYLNATLQPLSYTIPFSVYLRTEMYKKKLHNNIATKLCDDKREKQKLSEKIKVDITTKELEKTCENTVTQKMSDLMIAMWRENCDISPKSIKKKIAELNNEFYGYKQNDSQEALNLILDRIHEETKTEVVIEFCDMPNEVYELIRKRQHCAKIIKDNNQSIEIRQDAKDEYNKYQMAHSDASTILGAYVFWKKYVTNSYSIITHLFTGLFYSHVTCNECGGISESHEPFTMLSIETKQQGETTLQECLKHFSEEEELDDKYKCSTCKKMVDAKKKMYIWEPPDVLIIHLKRFKNEITKHGNYAHSHISKTNSVIDFPIKGLKLDDNYCDLNKKDWKYNLYAITEHNGYVNGGHYIAYCKNPINNKWYEFDDARVFHIPDSKIEGELVTKNAYILYYIREM
jgi:ubiquitin carboxyl-terminal hydrolase 8